MSAKAPEQSRRRRAEADPSAGRLYVAAAFLATTIIVGAAGYKAIGSDDWTWFDAFYMTLITLSTVGYGETLPGMDTTPWAREWTLALILTGTGSLLYFVSMLTAFVVEGDLRGMLGGRRMKRIIDSYRQHFIVCGAGTTGRHIIGELIATKTPFVAVESHEERIEELLEEFGDDLIYVKGDATDDDVLEEAGIRLAAGLLSALRDDRDNLMVTITARSLNDNIRIVARAVEPGTERKLRKAGADSVVSPNYIGGMRLVSEMIRPSVVQFLDVMLRDKQNNVRIESVVIPHNSRVDGMPLKNSGIRERTNLLIIALAEPDGAYVYNPGPDHRLASGQTLVVMGGADEVGSLAGVIAM